MTDYNYFLYLDDETELIAKFIKYGDALDFIIRYHDIAQNSAMKFHRLKLYDKNHSLCIEWKINARNMGLFDD